MGLDLKNTAFQYERLYFVVQYIIYTEDCLIHVPHLRSGWVVLIPLLQSYRTYGSKKKN